MKTRAFLTTFAALCLAHTAGAVTATWINALGGSWDTAGNWQGNSVPTWAPDLTVDFSTRNIIANRDLSLNTGGKVVGKIIFGDITPTYFQWDIVSGNGPLTLSTTLPLPSPAKPVIEVVNSTSVITVTLAGTQGFEKTGTGTLRLNNQTNGITGEILVSQGVLQIRDGGVTTNPGVTFQATTMADRSIRVTGNGVLDLWRNAASTTDWALPVMTLENGGTLRFRAAAGVTGTLNHNVVAALTAGTNGGTILNNGGDGAQNVTLSGALSGSGPLAFTARDGGTNTRSLLISSADNLYSGNWTVSHSGSGTALLRAGAANALGTGTVTLNAGATLENNATNGLNSLAGVTLTDSTSTLTLGGNPWTNSSATLTAEYGTIQLGSGGASTVGTFLLDSAGTVTLDAGGSLAATSFDIRQGTLAGTGSLTGTGTLTKSTSGTATLAGTHSYTGPTKVDVGTLVVNGSIASSSLTTVNAGATLMGTGTVGATTVSGTLAPGNSIGTLIINGDLVLAGTSDFEIDPNGVLADLADLADVSGNLTYGGTLNVTNIGGAFSYGDTFNLFDWGGTLTGNFTTLSLPSLDNGWVWQNNLLNDGTITVVPEPSATIGLTLLLSSALLFRRRTAA